MASKLTQKRADELRSKVKAGEWTWDQATQECGISRSMVQLILEGKRWTGVRKPAPGDAWHPERIRAVQEGLRLPDQEIAERLGMGLRSYQAITQARNSTMYRRPGAAVVKLLEQLEHEAKRRKIPSGD